MKKFTFYAVWIILAPFVWMFFVWSDLINGRHRYPTHTVKFQLVLQAAKEKMGIVKKVKP